MLMFVVSHIISVLLRSATWDNMSLLFAVSHTQRIDALFWGVLVTHIARVWINRVGLPILIVVS